MSAADDNDLHYVPALPGFDVLTFLPDDGAFIADPVAAWCVLVSDEGFAVAVPVSTRPIHLDDDPTVRTPDGSVTCGDSQWATDAEWLADMIAGVEPGASKSATINTGQPNVLSLDSLRRKLQSE